MSATWTAPVRYAEADQQGVVFNAHYLLYCDEALNSFCVQRGLDAFVHLVRLKKSSLTWHASATWGDVVEVEASCTGVGRTSFTMTFEIRVDERSCCSVETIYVHTDRDGVAQSIADAERATLQGGR